ncbi:hypothetical protein U2P60_01075 [Brucella sp. H1_1004]|uniref:hypothetical protein n=1 Tax=Brucella sp. H1_1004 TaxID=3110109 RepID=UPI0039B3D148
MSKKSTIVVAFPRGGIIPASVLDASDDYTAPPHKPVEVPKAYGEHLIIDRLAYDVLEADKRRKAQAETTAQSAASSDTDKAELDRLNTLAANLTVERDKLTVLLADEAGKIERLKTDNNKLSVDLAKVQLSLKTATDTIAQLEADKVKLSGAAGELQRDLDEAHQLLKTERENVVTLTEQLAEATKPPVQQQESLKMEGETGKSK